jgi:periplasmic protein TonB
MELTADLSFSLHPREVVDADARRWHRAVTFSVVFHALVLGAVIQQHLLPLDDVRRSLPPLTVMLQKAVQAPAAVFAPAAPEEPTRHEPVREYRQHSIRTPTPSPEILRAPADSTFATPLASTAPTTSDALPPQAPATPEAASPPTPPHHAPAADPNALAGYYRALAAAVDRHKHYPRIALIRQWQGTVVLQLNIGVDGRVQEHHLARSSGYEALDQEALEMLREAMPLPALPAQLAGVSLSVNIPVIFRIAD